MKNIRMLVALASLAAAPALFGEEDDAEAGLAVADTKEAFEAQQKRAGKAKGAPKKAGASPNVVVNSGFEHDDDGVARYQFIDTDFDWGHYDGDDFEKYCLDCFRVVTDERHSGEKSLRVTLNKTLTRISYHPGSCVTEAGKSGVLSLWMKSTVDRLPVHIQYGNGKREVTVGRTWKRYECCAPELPKPSWLSYPANVYVPNPQRFDATLWIDDVQCEYVESPEAKANQEWLKRKTEDFEADDGVSLLDKQDDTDLAALDEGNLRQFPGGFDPAKSYASPYRPSDLDAKYYGPGVKDNDDSPRGTTPVILRDTAALRGYLRADGETVVLPQFSYYMNERTAKFRVWDEDGRLAEAAVDIAALPCGTNAVTVKAHGRDFTGEIVKLPYELGAAQVNNFSRSLVHNGEPLFHAGICSLSRRMPMAPDGRNHAIDYMKKLGFKTTHMPIWYDKRYAPPAIAAVKYCEKVGMKMLLWPGEEDDKSPDAKWPRDRTLKGMMSPCIFALQVLDEPDMSVPSDKARDWIRYNKNLFPYKSVFINNTCIAVGSDYAGKEGDINMLDDYLTNNPFRNVDSVVRHVDRMRRQKPGKPAWNFLVGYNVRHSRPPTYREQIAQSWGWICGGGTGFSWYIEIPFIRSALQSMVDINREVQENRDIILSEEIAGEAGADVGPCHLRTMTRRYRGQWSVFACNIDHKPFGAVTFTMPPDAPQSGTVDVLYENRTLELASGKFTDAFEGHSRHIYRIR